MAIDVFTLSSLLMPQYWQYQVMRLEDNEEWNCNPFLVTLNVQIRNLAIDRSKVPKCHCTKFHSDPSNCC